MNTLDWLAAIIAEPLLHVKWLNTLSLLENCGARLIAQSEHPRLVCDEVLRHAAEEFRHAYHLRVFANRIAGKRAICNYQHENILGGWNTFHYLPRLNIRIVRWLQKEGSYRPEEVRELAYLLVTYAIEVRALGLYHEYDRLLAAGQFPFAIQGILREEEQHLREIEAGIATWREGMAMAHRASNMEIDLFSKWSRAIVAELDPLTHEHYKTS